MRQLKSWKWLSKDAKSTHSMAHSKLRRISNLEISTEEDAMSQSINWYL
jgi:hypothetical protein